MTIKARFRIIKRMFRAWRIVLSYVAREAWKEWRSDVDGVDAQCMYCGAIFPHWQTRTCCAEGRLMDTLP